MKLYCAILFFTFSLFLNSQQSVSIDYGNSIAIDEVDIEFVDVLEDSRCPANVNCIQAGKAIVLVNVYVVGRILEERKLEFHPSGFHNLNITTLYNFDGLRITGMNLLPYPVAQSSISDKEYYLELSIN